MGHKRSLRSAAAEGILRFHIACGNQFAAPAGILINSVFIARRFTFG
jgi:hypothetical protein